MYCCVCNTFAIILIIQLNTAYLGGYTLTAISSFRLSRPDKVTRIVVMYVRIEMNVSEIDRRIPIGETVFDSSYG